MRPTMPTYTDAAVLPLAEIIYALPLFMPPKVENAQIDAHNSGAEGTESHKVAC